TIPPATLLLTATQPCWYVDPQRGEAGSIDLPWPQQTLTDFLSMPAVTPAEAALVGSVLREVAPDLPLPPAQDASTLRVIDVAPVPRLSLDTLPTHSWSSQPSHDWLDFATVSFDYAGVCVAAQSPTT